MGSSAGWIVGSFVVLSVLAIGLGLGLGLTSSSSETVTTATLTSSVTATPASTTPSASPTTAPDVKESGVGVATFFGKDATNLLTYTTAFAEPPTLESVEVDPADVPFFGSMAFEGDVVGTTATGALTTTWTEGPTGTTLRSPGVDAVVSANQALRNFDALNVNGNLALSFLPPTPTNAYYFIRSNDGMQGLSYEANVVVENEVPGSGTWQATGMGFAPDGTIQYMAVNSSAIGMRGVRSDDEGATWTLGGSAGIGDNFDDVYYLGQCGSAANSVTAMFVRNNGDYVLGGSGNDGNTWGANNATIVNSPAALGEVSWDKISSQATLTWVTSATSLAAINVISPDTAVNASPLPPPTNATNAALKMLGPSVLPTVYVAEGSAPFSMRYHQNAASNARAPWTSGVAFDCPAAVDASGSIQVVPVTDGVYMVMTIAAQLWYSYTTDPAGVSGWVAPELVPGTSNLGRLRVAMFDDGEGFACVAMNTATRAFQYYAFARVAGISYTVVGPEV